MLFFKTFNCVAIIFVLVSLLLDYEHLAGEMNIIIVLTQVYVAIYAANY